MDMAKKIKKLLRSKEVSSNELVSVAPTVETRVMLPAYCSYTARELIARIEDIRKALNYGRS